MRFRDRADAGRRLASLLLHYRGQGARVFGLNAGGVRVAYEVARALEVTELDAWVARTVEVRGEAGSRLGAVSEGEGYFLNADMVRSASALASELTGWMDAEAGEVALQAQRLRGSSFRLEAGPGTVVLVADGIAVGDCEIYAALRGLRRQQPRHLVLAVPVAAAEELERLRLEAEEVICPHPVWSLLSVESAYEDFRGVPDTEVRQLLERGRQLQPGRQVLLGGEAGEWL